MGFTFQNYVTPKSKIFARFYKTIFSNSTHRFSTSFQKNFAKCTHTNRKKQVNKKSDIEAIQDKTLKYEYNFLLQINELEQKATRFF